MFSTTEVMYLNPSADMDDCFRAENANYVVYGPSHDSANQVHFHEFEKNLT